MPAFLAGSVGFAWLLQALNLPESAWPAVAYAFGLGLLIGRWWAALGALMVLSVGLGDEWTRELTGYVVFIYLPAAVAIIVLGVAVHRFLLRRVRRRAREQVPSKPAIR